MASGPTLVLSGCRGERREFGHDEQQAGQAGDTSGARGGASAAGGDGSADGGSAGSGESTLCNVDADCDDDMACNGVERCVESLCQAGEPTCANPDPDNCEAPCQELGAGEFECGEILGRDADGDQVRSSACAEAPGDDCDDDDETVFMGAEETCDGLDNDCDGKTDLDDGLALAGTARTVQIKTTDSSVAWSNEYQVYGIALTGNPDGNGAFPHNVYFASIDVANEPTLETEAFTAYAGSEASGTTGIAWGAGQFGVAYRGAYNDIQFQLVSFNGSVEEAIEVDPPDGSGSFKIELGWAASSGVWGIAWEEGYVSYYGVKARTVDAEGDVSAEQVLVAQGGRHVRMAMSGDDFGVVWGLTNDPDEDEFWIDWMGRSAAFARPETLTVSNGTSASKPVIAGNGAGFGVAWLDGTNIVFKHIDVDGSTICGPITLAASSREPYDMVDTQRGFLILSKSMGVDAIEVLDGCRWGQQFSIDAAGASAVSIARGGDQGYAVVWDTAATAAASDVKSRTFGPNYCD